MAFATTTELGNWLDTDLTGKTDQAQLALDVATARIQTWTRQTIERVADDAIELRGTWAPVLELPERPVESVGVVEVDGEAQTLDDDYVVVKNELRRPGPWPSTLRFTAYGPSGWGGPDVLVAVTYTHGYETIPDDIKGVCLAVAGKTFRNPQEAVVEQIDDYRIEYARRAAAVFEEYKDVLAHYRRGTRSMSQF